MATSFVLHPADTLSQPFDVAARWGRFQNNTSLKGLFFNRLTAVLGPDGFDKVLPSLQQPPSARRYSAWRDYPQPDYFRLTVAAAERQHVGVPAAEQLRRLARDDFATLAREPTGRLALAFARSPSTLLGMLPKLYRMVLAGGSVHVVSQGADFVELEYREFFGQLDCYVLGQLEGMVRHYKVHPRLEVRLERVGHGFIKVYWSHAEVSGAGRVLRPAI